MYLLILIVNMIRQYDLTKYIFQDSHDSEENSNKIKRLSIKPKTNRGKDMETALTLKGIVLSAAYKKYMI